jgi:hypothetical protein
MDIEQFKYDWQFCTKSDILRKYPGFTYKQLKSKACYHKVRKHQDLIYHRKLYKIMDNTIVNWYWNGFIIGDGYVSNKGLLTVMLSAKDKDHILKLSDWLECKMFCRSIKYPFHSDRLYDVCGINITDKINVDLWRQMFKITTAKTYKPYNLDCITSDEHFLSFFIGLIDADGCIFNKGIRIQHHGNHIDNLKLMATRLISLGFTSAKTKMDNRGYAHIQLYTKADRRALLSFAIKHNLPIMDRKWNKVKILT